MAMLRQGEDTEQLCICMTQDEPQPFFITTQSVRGGTAKIKCVDLLMEGLTFQFLPLECEEDAIGVGPEEILNHKQRIEAQVVSRDSSMRYTIRYFQQKASHLRSHIRSGGHPSQPELQLSITQAGPVFTISAKGDLGVTNSARLSDTIKNVSQKAESILIDISEITVMSSIGIGMIIDGYKTASARGVKTALLLDPLNPVVAVLASTKLTQVIPTFTTRDEAVAMLLLDS